MEPKEIYVRSLLAQYQVFRQELIVFTIFFLLAMLMIPIAWVVNHVYHGYQLGCMIGVVAMILGLAMATHCGNTLKVLRRVASNLNKEMNPDHCSFEYDLGKETGRVRYIVTLIGKVIGCLLLLWCFVRWPQM